MGARKDGVQIKSMKGKLKVEGVEARGVALATLAGHEETFGEYPKAPAETQPSPNY